MQGGRSAHALDSINEDEAWKCRENRMALAIQIGTKERADDQARPAIRWGMVNFIELMLRELQHNGVGFPKVLLLRKKQIQRRSITPQLDKESARRAYCSLCRCSGWQEIAPQGSTPSYQPCNCRDGGPHRYRLFGKLRAADISNPEAKSTGGRS